eukprot:m.158171 g.158171  ORF g.158171 m.158171 type:complete len:186 (+) comp16460_c0_seq12:185-742(+)
MKLRLTSLLHVAMYIGITAAAVNFTDTRGLQLSCAGGGHLTRYNMRPWCWCSPKAPVCLGEECILTWGQPIQKEEPYQFQLLNLQFANATQATDNGWVLFDGYPPTCDRCTCYDANKPQIVHLDHALRRYKLLHSHMRYGLRPRRLMDYSPVNGGGWGDKLRGMLVTTKIHMSTSVSLIHIQPYY